MEKRTDMLGRIPRRREETTSMPTCNGGEMRKDIQVYPDCYAICRCRPRLRSTIPVSVRWRVQLFASVRGLSRPPIGTAKLTLRREPCTHVLWQLNMAICEQVFIRKNTAGRHADTQHLVDPISI